MKKHSIGSLLFIGLVLVIMYLPIAVVVVYSFNANTARIPIDFTGWTTAWYGKLFENRSGFGDALLLSVRVALWAVVISCVIGTLGAIGLANRAGILSGAFLALAMSLDDFVISFFVYGAGEGTLPIKIYSSVKVGVSPQVNALCTLIMGVVFIAVALSRYLSSVRAARQRRMERQVHAA